MTTLYKRMITYTAYDDDYDDICDWQYENYNEWWTFKSIYTSFRLIRKV